MERRTVWYDIIDFSLMNILDIKVMQKYKKYLDKTSIIIGCSGNHAGNDDLRCPGKF